MAKHTTVKKRSPFAIVLVFLLGALWIGGLCNWVVIKPLKESHLCLFLPDSLRNPPIPPNADQIEYGKFSYKVREGFEGKLIQFQTIDSPAEILDFYTRSLGQDEWEEEWLQMVDPDPNQVDLKFNWLCGFETRNAIAELWLHAEVLDSGKTEVKLDFEYKP